MISLPKISEWLRLATTQLEEAGIATARLDSIVLLEDTVKQDRSWLLAHPEHVLSNTDVRKLRHLLAQRTKHEPLAYIRGKTEFYGREFIINHKVLEPRPESETMIEICKQLSLPKDTVLVDIGTGSGALAITVKLELPQVNVIATDFDPSCLRVASKNAKKMGAQVRFLLGDLLSPINDLQINPTVLLCNLPYVPDSFQINPAALQEPRAAIFGGHDGLDVYRRLLIQLDTTSLSPSFILTEALPPQHDVIASLVERSGYELEKADDFIQLFVRHKSQH
jgi:release factor glutamine methyltransferase